MIQLRGHHLLCLLGYRGMGYSMEYVENMTRIHRLLRANPSTEICIVFGPDDLCCHFPDSQPYHCRDQNIEERDLAVLSKLGLQCGERLAWADVLQRIQSRVVREDIGQICTTCGWRAYGVCEEGVNEVRQGRGMRGV